MRVFCRERASIDAARDANASTLRAAPSSFSFSTETGKGGRTIFGARARGFPRRHESCHDVQYDTARSLFSRAFCTISGKHETQIVFRAKKSTRASFGKVLRVTRGARHAVAPTTARAYRTRARRVLSTLARLETVNRSRISAALSTGSARTRNRGGSRHAFLARPTLPRSVARFLRTRFRLAQRPRRRAGGDLEPKRRARESGRVGLRCFSVRCFSAPARPSRR